MQDYQTRVIIEEDDLRIKTQALRDFMHNKAYGDLVAVEQGLLMVQLVAMENYQGALKRRIEIFD